MRNNLFYYLAVGGTDATLLLGLHGLLESAQEGCLEGHGWLLAVKADSVQQLEGGMDLGGLSGRFVEGAQNQTAGGHHLGMRKSGQNEVKLVPTIFYKQSGS